MLRVIAGLLVCAIVAVFLAAGAPYVYAELGMRHQSPLVGPKPVKPTLGRWVDDYFVVQPVDEATFAIGEPRYYQGNYSYLILGWSRAVLFDAGTGTRNIDVVVRSLTKLPVTVIPSHLHFDHVGALGHFERTALIDLPALRARLRRGALALTRYEFLGFIDGLKAPVFKVDEWWPADGVVDLGGRHLLVLHTPGHTPSSVSLYDEVRHQLFCGDFIYPGPLYAFLPGASRRSYLQTGRMLITRLDPATHLYTAHMTEDPSVISAPVLEMADLRALQAALVDVQSGRARSTGFYPRVFPVRGDVVFATGFPWNNR